MTLTEHKAWRSQQESRYRKNSFKKHVCLFRVLMAVEKEQFTVTFNRPE
jgi:hypothetical protein